MTGPTLFSKPPEYTIDTCCFFEIFRDNGRHTKASYPTLWKDICELISQGIIISHIEVFKEIEPGDELHTWAAKNKNVFSDYVIPAESSVIASMTTKYKDFVNAKVKSVHADPWLIAQAKTQNLKIITEELLTTGSVPKPKSMRIPDVCADPILNIPCINLLGLIKERGWKY